MKMKSLCLFIGMLVITMTIPVTLANYDEMGNIDFNNTSLDGYYLFGFMSLIDPETSNSEFEVVSFVFIRGNGETTRLNQGEMIKIYAPIFGLVFNNFFIRYVGDYSIIG